MTTETAEDVGLLEDILNEPHCTASHASPYNRKCTHTVTHYVLYPCGCTDDACDRQVSFIRFVGTVSSSLFCGDCMVSVLVEDCVITPRIR